jgi:ribose/xylose/arabinose/galactoside ABC-type transport system permease subunit
MWMKTGSEAKVLLPRERAYRFQQRLLDSCLVLFAVVMGIYYSFASPYFLSVRNFMNILSSVSIVGIISTGMTLVIITKGIDLSVSSTIALSGCLVALGVENLHMPWGLAVLMALLCGTFSGMINGFLITRLRVPPFIATLGTLNIMRGVAFIITNGQAIYTRSKVIAFWGAGYAFGAIPVPGIITLVAFVVIWAISRFTVFGRQVFAVGGNPVASRLSGINVDRIKFTLYTLTGFLAAVSGMVMLGLASTAMPSAGDGYNLDTITAVYLGGNSSEGGEGSVWRTLLGVLIIGLMNNGMALLSVQSYWQTFAKGCLLIIAVVIDVLRRPSA